MKILLICYEFPPIGGGTGKCVHAAARELAKLGTEVVVLTSAFGDLPMEETLLGFRVIRIPVSRTKPHQASKWQVLSFAVSGIKRAGKVLHAFHPDVTLAYFTIPSGLISYYMYRRAGIPFLIYLRGQDVPGFIPESLRLEYCLTRPVIRYLWKKSSYVISLSDGLTRLAQATARHQSFETIRNGVDFEYFKPGEKKIKKERLLFLFVGRFHVQKALPYLLHAVGRLTDPMRKRMTLRLVGAGPEEREIKKLVVRLKLEDTVSIVDYRKGDDLVAEYQAADVFVNPSLNDAFPNAVAEAMACGLPLLLSTVPGHSEVVESGANGFLIPPRQVEPLRRAIEQFIEMPNARLQQMGRWSRTYAVNNLKWPEIAESILRLAEKSAAINSE